jgi:putative ABC transport system permease protein
MDATRYIVLSLLHYRWAYLGVLAGAALGATVLLGALFAGDSVAASLRALGEKRIGRTTHLVSSGDRFFRQALADEFGRAVGARAAALLYLRGTAVNPATRGSANHVQLLGVTEAFWNFAPGPTQLTLKPGSTAIAINETLAHRLQAKVGDTLVLRLQKPGILVGNAPVAGAEASLETIRCTVSAIADDAGFGRFNLEATQVPAPTAFIPIELLQQSLERPGKANVMLVTATETNPPAEKLQQALRSSVQLADYGLSVKWLEVARAFEIASDRIFIDPELAEAIRAAVPEAQPVTSYLVNEFRLGDRRTPYSIATATTSSAAPFLPGDLEVDEIVLNQWLAEDLDAQTGSEVRLTYFQAGAGDSLVETTRSFRVRSIVPLEGLAADRAWMPNFPGISDVSRPSDWDPGLPLDLNRIRPKDELYWDQHRGAPKAFLSNDAGRAHWSTRWGSLTGLRVAIDRSRENELVETLRRALRPEMNQLTLRNLRASAEQSAQSTVDFGGLFIGMSFFLILASLGLVAMLFQFCLLQRNREEALLGAVGISARRLLRWRMAEGLAVLLVGGAVGLAGAIVYTRGILRFLETIWAGSGGSALFTFAASPASIAIGGAAFVSLSLAAIWLAIRRQVRRALSIRLAAQAEDTRPGQRIRTRSLIIAIVAALGGVAAVVASGRNFPPQAAFFVAGFALLVAGLALCRAWLASRTASARAIDAAYLGALNLKTRRSRSLTVIGLIATAVFMVLSVASFRKHVGSDWLERRTGTGGFSFWIETTLPQNIARDGRSQGFEIFQRQAGELGEIVPLRAGSGDNVNCFNLNSTLQPRLLAVDAARIAARKAFFLKIPGAKDGDPAGWNRLGAPAREGGLGSGRATSSPIPAFVDETTLMWALKRKVGDVLSYPDENGRSFDVQIVGTLPDSIFQGHVIVDEKLFLERFPSSAGYSLFLADARDPGAIETVRGQLATALRDAGGRVETTQSLLASFHQIENTYIAIFNVLGSLGVILGSLGLAIVVARNLRERRGEFAVMSAIGIPRRVLGRMVFAEFSRLVLWGIAIGTAASLVAVWPSLTTLPPAPTLGLVLGMLLGIVALNLLSGWLVFRWSLRELRPSVALATA